jgi:hypothetical protein
VIRDPAQDLSIPWRPTPRFPLWVILENAKKIRMTPYGLQDANGVDVTLIEEALKLSPIERLAVAERTRRGVLAYLNARRIS